MILKICERIEQIIEKFWKTLFGKFKKKNWKILNKLENFIRKILTKIQKILKKMDKRKSFLKIYSKPTNDVKVEDKYDFNFPSRRYYNWMARLYNMHDTDFENFKKF